MLATAIRPAHSCTHVPAPGISATEADLIARAARRFLDRTDAASAETAMAIVTTHITALTRPYMPASIGEYDCEMPNNTHWCSSR